jgi:hypothetical protein
MADIARDKARQHGVAVAGATDSASAPRRKETASPTDGEALASRAKTRSWDYIWRSGVAGGVAGCAVSYSSQLSYLASYKIQPVDIYWTLLTNRFATGQNDCGAS